MITIIVNIKRIISNTINTRTNQLQTLLKFGNHYYKFLSVTRGDAAIVNIASISGYRVQPDRWTYAATKAAILNLTRFMALDLSKDGIRVNSVSPGWVWSPEVNSLQE